MSAGLALDLARLKPGATTGRIVRVFVARGFSRAGGL